MSGIDRVAEHLRDEVYKKPSLIDATMLEEFSESYIYYLAATSLTNVQYPATSHQAIYRREKQNEDFERLMTKYIETHRDRAIRELRQMDADNEADARADAREAA
jgi:hypothetical protein